MAQVDDHILLLMGVSDGYPLPSQHPANALLGEDRFEFALAVACMRNTLRVTPNNKLILTEKGKRELEVSAITVHDQTGGAA